jgi:hypothetical protein
MMLKIMRHLSSDMQDWWMLDDIRKISVSKDYAFSEYEDINQDLTVHDISIMDYFYKNEDKQSQAFRFKILICRDSKGDEFSIMFDTLAYLCNDVGKTIEKIVVNIE